MVTPYPVLPNEKPIKWASVNVQEVIDTDYRLEASVYVSDGRQAKRELANCRWPLRNLSGDDGLVKLYRHPQFKNIYVDESDFPYYQPAQINQLAPKPSAFLSPSLKAKVEALRVKKGQVLLTCSGTIGNCTYVRNALDNLIFSSDLIRIEPEVDNGFIYAFLKSKTGQALIAARNYGAVIQHINPEHLYELPVPNPPPVLKQEIHDLVEESFKLRDDSNELMAESQDLLKTALQLPSIEELHERAEQFDKTAEVLNYSVSSTEVVDRLDASYYVPIVKTIEQYIARTASAVVKVKDSQISQSVIFPYRFKRVYVEEGNGVIFIGGKQIFELDPNNKKYLSLKQHEDRIKNQLTLRQNMTLITCSGTIGKVTIVPQHWDGWTANQHIIRVVPTNAEIAGYLYAWLSSDYAYPLITRYTHGAVIDEINDAQVAEIVVPLLRDANAQRAINEKVLEANRKRTEAYHLEREALTVLDEKVIYAR